jgi:NAD(P)-dependent dehydrogenase (short-subunit alcohol dehydrogenase family)
MSCFFFIRVDNNCHLLEFNEFDFVCLLANCILLFRGSKKYLQTDFFWKMFRAIVPSGSCIKDITIRRDKYMGKLQNKTALITGASSGIGKASAELFAKEGATVLLADMKEENAARVANEIKADGGDAESYFVDISDEQSVINLVDHIKQSYNRIDVLFNNAGTDTQGGKLHEYPVDLFDRLIAVDLRGTFLVSRYVIPLMLENGGNVINTTSVSGLAADLNRSGYNAAKGGVTNLTKTMAIDYARDGIRVNAIAPGTIETPLIDDLMGEEGGKKFRQAYEWVDPMGRLGTAEEIATVALFLASTDSSYVTGEIITADGGHMAYTWPGEMLYNEKYKK